MKYLLLTLTFLIISCKSETKEENLVSNDVETTETAYNLEIYDFNGIEKFLKKEDDKVYVVNFWATWCKPCIKELPYFEGVNEKYADKGVEVLLVSLDFPQHFETKLVPFIQEHELKSKVLALDDPDMNSWIPKVSEEWTGSIPATIIYNKNKRQFYERSFMQEELETELKQFLK